MGDTTLQIICNWIVLVGAVTVAVINIIKFFKAPTAFLKRKKDEAFKKQLMENLEEILPILLEKQDEEIHELLQEIKEIDLKQSTKIDVLTQSTRDVLRQNIMRIYHKYKDTRQIPIYDKESLDELYKDYSSQNGNSYILKYYNRMCKWEVIYNINDDEE